MDIIHSSYLSPTAPIRTKICMVGSLPDIITYAKFQVEIFRGYDFTGEGVEFPILLLSFAWALQQCRQSRCLWWHLSEGTRYSVWSASPCPFLCCPFASVVTCAPLIKSVLNVQKRYCNICHNTSQNVTTLPCKMANNVRCIWSSANHGVSDKHVHRI